MMVDHAASLGARRTDSTEVVQQCPPGSTSIYTTHAIARTPILRDAVISNLGPSRGHRSQDHWGSGHPAPVSRRRSSIRLAVGHEADERGSRARAERLGAGRGCRFGRWATLLAALPGPRDRDRLPLSRLGRRLITDARVARGTRDEFARHGVGPEMRYPGDKGSRPSQSDPGAPGSEDAYARGAEADVEAGQAGMPGGGEVFSDTSSEDPADEPVAEEGTATPFGEHAGSDRALEEQRDKYLRLAAEFDNF